jgi:hypothetical protein
MPEPKRQRLIDGKAGAFDRADIRVERPRDIERLELVDAQLAALGFKPLGDLVCTRFPDVLGRGYARAAGDVWGGLFFGHIESSFDFVTQWEEALLMTTINGRGEGDNAKRATYVTRLPHLGFDRLKELHAKHEERKALLTARIGKPLAAEPVLKSFAEAVDRGIARQLGKI